MAQDILTEVAEFDQSLVLLIGMIRPTAHAGYYDNHNLSLQVVP